MQNGGQRNSQGRDMSQRNSAMSDHGTLTAQLIDAMEQELASIPGESMSIGEID